jgi:ATP adenylyltransferase
VEQLWAPWRLEYIKSADDESGCIFCAAVDGDDEERLVVHRGEHTIVVLNKFPYASGHFMVAPTRHLAEFGELSAEEVVEIHRASSSGIGALAQLYVPRWAGDTNFMPVLADVKVLPEHLADTRRKLAELWPS